MVQFIAGVQSLTTKSVMERERMSEICTVANLLTNLARYTHT